jgi:hypothetical protein
VKTKPDRVEISRGFGLNADSRWEEKFFPSLYHQSIDYASAKARCFANATWRSSSSSCIAVYSILELPLSFFSLLLALARLPARDPCEALSHSQAFSRVMAGLWQFMNPDEREL